jgi:hypothetical protein
MRQVDAACALPVRENKSRLPQQTDRDHPSGRPSSGGGSDGRLVGKLS